MAVSKCVDLKVDRNLLDANFGGYKLSLDPLPTYSLGLNSDIDVAKLPDDLYSYQHLKAFGVHNHLCLDPWNANTVWFVDESWHIQKGTIEDWKLCGPLEMFEIPDSANRRLVPKRVNVSLSFTTSSWMAMSDGSDRLYLLHTGNRQQGTSWKVGYSGQPLGADVYFTILHSIWHSVDSTACIEVLCLYIDAARIPSAEKHASAFVTKLEWLTFQSDGEATTFKLVRTRRLESSACPNYATILPSGASITVMNEKPFRFTYDSVSPIVLKSENEKDAEIKEVEPEYTWVQELDNICVSFQLPESAVKNDIGFELHPGTINITLKENGAKEPQVLLAGVLAGSVNVDDSTWVIGDGLVLEVHLMKSEPVTWSELVVGDSRGKMVMSAEQLEAINDKLEKFTSDSANADPTEGRKPAFNTEQLEDCDAYSDESSAIWCLDGETHDVFQQVNVGGNQWLFSTTLSPDKLPIICLRHDVDGIVWQPLETVASGDGQRGSLAWQHVGTFDALGYVQASKQQRKFVTCAPSMTYAAIADCVRRVYVYHRPTAIKSPVRNRKTGETVAAVARQQLVSIESTSDILGMCASDTHIFVLAGKTLYAVRVGQHDL